MTRMLITGGAGFIGSHLADVLIRDGYPVRVFDCLDPQVHGEERGKPPYLNKRVEFILGDVRNKSQLSQAVQDTDVIFHFAAATGVGQSAYQIAHYIETNVGGTANLLDVIAPLCTKRRISLILASSRAVYGEGKYVCQTCGIVCPRGRTAEQLKAKDWQVYCSQCNQPVQPLPTDEPSHLDPVSFYGLSKHQQEELCLCFSRTYPISLTVLRFFNVYGPRQTMANPYTGILAVFSARLMHGRDLEIYEDGLESRDFIHVRDVVRACILAMRSETESEVFNVGSGVPVTLCQFANLLLEQYTARTPTQKAQVVGKYRVGDIRHCYSDTSKAQQSLGFSTQIGLADGLADWMSWATVQNAQDFSKRAEAELAVRSLLGR